MMAVLRSLAFAAIAMATLAILPGVASAQVLSPQRDCQTLLKCQYARGGTFRGCISAYSCRYCRTVASRCSVRGEQTCRKVVCGWGA